MLDVVYLGINPTDEDSHWVIAATATDIELITFSLINGSDRVIAVTSTPYSTIHARLGGPYTKAHLSAVGVDTDVNGYRFLFLTAAGNAR